MLQGEYAYDSDAFWATVPPITGLLLIIALVANWSAERRRFLLVTVAVTIVVSLVSILYLDPLFNELNAIGYRDVVDAILQRQAATWYAVDWSLVGVNLVGGVALLLALLRRRESLGCRLVMLGDCRPC